MNTNDFIKETILKFDPDTFIDFKNYLIKGKWLTFSFLNDEEITNTVLAEKVYDEIDKYLIKSARSFNTGVIRYMDELDSIIGKRIAKEPKHKKNEAAPPVPRARKYYDKVISNKPKKEFSTAGLLDYTRIMLCLYMAIINNGFQEIEDFDYSVSCLDLNTIITFMLQEQDKILHKNKYNPKDNNSEDSFVFIMTLILFFYIKTLEIKEED